MEYFPYNKLKAVQAYRGELRAAYYKPEFDQLDEHWLVRISQIGYPRLEMTFTGETAAEFGCNDPLEIACNKAMAELFGARRPGLRSVIGSTHSAPRVAIGKQPPRVLERLLHISLLTNDHPKFIPRLSVRTRHRQVRRTRHSHRHAVSANQSESPRRRRVQLPFSVVVSMVSTVCMPPLSRLNGGTGPYVSGRAL